ncbi:unnamed protein product [Microthlaspi erraticum]|uniref:Uncharacterized protein n=1 Tax=Microthlaspi erraticum TaxID=1685480 RepID=A0A6D2LQ37_9BRAS|nr:unnamed protein product [Microthlaspi erraticum]
MSRKGVIAKRVNCSRRLYRESAPKPRSPAGRGTHVPRSAKTVSVRLKSRPKSKTARPITQHDPGNIVPRSAKSHPTPAAHDQPREPGNKASRPRNPRVPRPMHPSEPGKNVPRPAEKPSAKSQSARPRRPTVNHPATTVPTRPRPDCPADRPDDRPNAAVDPKPVLKPISYFQARLNPKPPQKT